VFRSFQTSRCRIVPEPRTLTIYTRRKQLNDADFVMEIEPGEQKEVSDGRFVRASILDARGRRVVADVRMVFVKDTAPEKAVRDLPPGSRLRVFGIPRIDLSEIASRVEHAKQNSSGLEGTLPYEIVVIGVFEKRVRAA
jgi:hypothetical protein